jgi:hypothetical protein
VSEKAAVSTIKEAEFCFEDVGSRLLPNDGNLLRLHSDIIQETSKKKKNLKEISDESHFHVFQNTTTDLDMGLFLAW